MKSLTTRLLIGCAGFLFSSSLLASCPDVGGFTLSANAQNFSTCTYVANKVIIGALQNPKLCLQGFILTDPGYKNVSCKFSQQSNRCVCVIAKK